MLTYIKVQKFAGRSRLEGKRQHGNNVISTGELKQPLQ